MIFVYTLIIALGLNTIGFLVANRLKSDRLTDFSYGFTFLILALFSYLSGIISLNSTLLLIMICLWALRLATFLLIRVLKAGRDKRFDGVRENFWRFGRFWIFQGVTAWVIMAPAIYLLSDSLKTIRPLAILGIAIWFAGLVLEAIADYQKFAFNNRPINKGRWIDEGVWAYSRHPNYLGEIIVWIGAYIYCWPALNAGQRLISLISPLLITFLLMFVTGIPKLEKQADKRWGSLVAYRNYKRQVPRLIPVKLNVK